MSCVCCQLACDDTFKVHGHVVCFACTMNRSQTDIMAVIQEHLHLNVKTWEALSPS